MSRGRLVGIAIREESRAAMRELQRVAVSTSDGLQGDFRGRPGKRQVTVLSSQDWQQACGELGRDLPWTVRRANLMIDGLRFAGTTDATLRIGQVVLRVCGETDPCQRMDEQADGLQSALRPDWRGGACCRVVRGGVIELGDEVLLETAES